MGLFDSIGKLFESVPKEIGVAGIFSAASLASQMFGRDVDGESLDLARDKFNQDVSNQSQNLAFNREELASREKMQAASIAAQTQAAAISAGAQREIARANNRMGIGQARILTQDKASERNIEAQKGRPELIMTGRSAQANMARANGSAGMQAFESLMRGVQAGLTR
mgnify:CR=1 FL=1